MSTTAPLETAAKTKWPEGFDFEPAVHGFAVREVNAPADAVFAWIRRPDLHPAFYKQLRAVRHLGGPKPQLDIGSKLSFLVGAVLVPSVKVVQCDPAEHRFAWVAVAPGLRAVHAFTVESTGPTTSIVRSEEQWKGALASAGKLVSKGPLQKIQTQWVEAVVKAANQHPGGPPAA